MRVAMVTSWLPRWCGIAFYAENLVAALRAAGAEVHVVCHTDGGRPGEAHVHPVLDQTSPTWHRRLEEAVDAVRPDVVHIQHEFGLYALMERPGVYDFSPRNAFELAIPLYRWRVAGLPAVVTYHSVFSRLTREEALYYDHVMGLAAANILHEPYQRTHLPWNLGRLPDNLHVIPHGAGRAGPDRERVRALRAELGLGRRPVLGLMGWWEPNKGFERVLRLWPEVVRRVPEAVLVLAGDARPGSPTGPATREEYLAMVAASPARASIRVVRGAFSKEEYLAVLGTFDVMALPYTHASQSGNLAHAYQAGLPVIVSALEGLQSSVAASRAGLIVRDDRELLAAMVHLLSDREARRACAAAARRYVRREVAWDRVARRHLETYRWAVRHLGAAARRRDYLDHRVHV